jgi:hypothetical protein
VQQAVSDSYPEPDFLSVRSMGKIITTLPLAGSSDGGVFNPRAMQAFSSHGNGTLGVIKENSPTEFVLVEETRENQSRRQSLHTGCQDR